VAKYKNLIKELRWIPANELIRDERNPHIHSAKQREAMREILSTIGIAGALLGYEVGEGRVKLIDGHLRSEEIGDELVPVLILDVDDETAAKLLATYDPAGDLGQWDATALEKLLKDCDFHEGGIIAMLAELDTIDPETGKEKKGTGSRKPTAVIPVYPIAPVFDERYDYAIIFCKNAMEFATLQTLLAMQREKSYKSSSVGVGRVIHFSRFLALWDARHGAAVSVPLPLPVSPVVLDESPVTEVGAE
jgi:hypothetical protein